MSEEICDVNKKIWRNTERITIGRRKGQFKKKTTTKRKSSENGQDDSAREKAKRLRQEVEWSDHGVADETTFEPNTAPGLRRVKCLKRKQTENERGDGQKDDIKRARESDNVRAAEIPDAADVSAGRVIFEPSILADEMWCSNCDIPLSFRFAQNKVQKGLAFIYDIRCYKCSKMKSIHTSKSFRLGNKVLHEVNAEASLGVMDAGLGETQFNLLLSAMNISTVSDTLLKRYDRIVGPKLEELAQESCLEALQEELNVAEKANDIVTDE